MSINQKSSNTLPSSPSSDSNVQKSETESEELKIAWSPENEVILVEWCDVAQCYKWMHLQAHNSYALMHACFTIPAITLSTISGTASFAQASLPANLQVFAPMVIGTINILIGIFTTIQQYLKISELNESYRVAMIAWDKYARNIRIELSKSPKERMDAGHFLKLCRQEFDRLMETCPSVPTWVIAQFLKNFTGKEDSPERKRFDKLKKPDICNFIVSADEYRHHWYIDVSNNVNKIEDSIILQMGPPSDLAMASISNKLNLLMNQSEHLIKSQHDQKELELAMLLKDNVFKMENQLKEDAYIKKQTELITDYITSFNQTNGRDPFNDEIIDHFSENTFIANSCDEESQINIELENQIDINFVKLFLATKK